MGRPFGTLEEVEAEVNAGMADYQAQLEDIERRLEESDLSTEERSQLEKDRKQLRTFFWWVRGGDESGEPPPD